MNNVPQGWRTLLDTREFEILGWWWGFGMVESENCPKTIFLVPRNVFLGGGSSSNSNSRMKSIF